MMETNLSLIPIFEPHFSNSTYTQINMLRNYYVIELLHGNWFKRDPKSFSFSTFSAFLNFKGSGFFSKMTKPFFGSRPIKNDFVIFENHWINCP